MLRLQQVVQQIEPMETEPYYVVACMCTDLFVYVS